MTILFAGKPLSGSVTFVQQLELKAIDLNRFPILICIWIRNNKYLHFQPCCIHCNGTGEFPVIDSFKPALKFISALDKPKFLKLFCIFRKSPFAKPFILRNDNC